MRVPKVAAIRPLRNRGDNLKPSGAKSQSICFNCHFVGHAWDKCQCGSDLVTLNNKVKAPKKGDEKGWKELILAYAWLIHNRLGSEYPCPELAAYKSKCALGLREDYKEENKILEAWVLKLDAGFQQARNKT